MNHFTINKSSYFPQIEKMENNQFDYVAYCYEFVFPIDEKTEKSLAYICYAIIDCYNNTKNATFDICYDPGTGDTFLYHLNPKRKTSKRNKVFILSEHDKVKFRPLTFNLQLNDYKSMKSLFNSIVKDIKNELNNLPSYFTKNDITYNATEMQDFSKRFVSFIKENHPCKIIPQEYNQADTLLIHNYLEKNVKTSHTTLKRNKL